MSNVNATSPTSSAEWQVRQVFTLAVVCLMIGLAVGYLFRGSRSPVPSPPPMQASSVQTGAPSGAGAPNGMGNQPVTLDQMKQMADKKAEPLVAKLKDDPNDADLLIQVGNIYLSTHQFKEAAEYFGKSLAIKPKNIPIRTQMASCLYYSGDVDGALKQLERATADDPKDANSLFNLGYVRLQGKKDAKGALAAWSQLLKTNPQLEPAKKAQVEKIMADVRSQNSGN
jgi:cytochrome c-type biogenesis protein CcmH/NrfG